jgi:minor extracellular serine protease Vpr
VTVDQTPPIIGLESNQPTGTVKGIIEDKTWIEKLEWKASDGNCWNKLDVQWVEEGKFQFAHTFTKGELSPGSHSIVLQAEDSAGNVTEKTVTVTIQ